MRVKPYSDEVPVPERAPYGTLGARRLYVHARVLLPVPLKPPELLRRSGETSCTGQYRYPVTGQRNGFPRLPATRHRRRRYERALMDMPARMTTPAVSSHLEPLPGSIRCSARAAGSVI